MLRIVMVLLVILFSACSAAPCAEISDEDLENRSIEELRKMAGTQLPPYFPETTSGPPSPGAQTSSNSDPVSSTGQPTSTRQPFLSPKVIESSKRFGKGVWSVTKALGSATLVTGAIACKVAEAYFSAQANAPIYSPPSVPSSPPLLSGYSSFASVLAAT